MKDRYGVQPAELRYGETQPALYFIRDALTGELVRARTPGQRPGRLRSFKKRADAEKAVRALNESSACAPPT